MTEKGQHTSLLPIALFATPIIAYTILQSLQRKQKQNPSSKPTNPSQSLSNVSRGTLRPPLPKEVRSLLSQCRLANLSTVDSSAQCSHISLMCYTYLPQEEVVIMSTNKNTKKYDMLLQQKGVALLVHDFGSGEGDSSRDDAPQDQRRGMYSITLNGTCDIVIGDDAERYRSEHLKHNPEYPQFIVGDNIAILLINVSTARICDIADRVLHWELKDQ